MENLKSEIETLVACAECGVKVSIDDAESSYNAELDDVFFYCHKCMPAVSDDFDEPDNTGLQADGRVCPDCGADIPDGDSCFYCDTYPQPPAAKA